MAVASADADPNKKRPQPNASAPHEERPMSTATADAAGELPRSPSHVASEAGPLEEKHRRSANYRAVADNTGVTRTHWHIATANGLGWGFDGMDGVIFALVS